MIALRFRLLTVGLGGLLLLAGGLPAGAWGANGHRVVGQVAENHLSEKTLRAIESLLEGDSLARISTWPDFVRSDPAFDFATAWHYISLEADEDLDTAERSPAGDIIVALARLQADLRNPSSAELTPRQTLAFLVHLIGDLHQPLHVGRRADRGGNGVRVTWFGDSRNLHSVWDSAIIDQERLSYRELSDFIDHPSLGEIEEWQSTGVLDWMEESRQLRETIYSESDDFEDDSDTRLSYRYSFRNLPRVEGRLLKAGVRLAGILNAIFDGDGGDGE